MSSLIGPPARSAREDCSKEAFSSREYSRNLDASPGNAQESPITSEEAPLSARVARWISIAGHPFVVVILLVGIVSVSRLGARGALRPVVLMTLAVLLPLGTFMALRAKSGRWSTIDASRPAERPPLYFVALSLTALLAAWFATSPRFGFLGRGGAAVCLLLVAAALLNRWIKTSLHVAFAAYAAAVLLFLNRPAGLALLAFVPVLGWARLAMHRHSLLEVLAGALLGGLVGILAVAI